MLLNKKISLAFARLPSVLINFKLAFLFLIFAVGIIYSSIMPPLQSPDEFVHISRAYLFYKGKIILDAPRNSSSGGLIDDGLLKYINSYSFLSGNPNKILSRTDIESANDITWTQKRSFSVVSGAAYYFPAVYAPHALGLLIGEKLDLSVDQSYRLARFFAFSASVLIIVFAFKLFPANFFVASLLILPMSIFQIVSASIDGLTTAFSILCASLFMRGFNKNYQYSNWMAYLLAISIFITSTSRIHLLPLVALPLFIYFIRRTKINLWTFVTVAMLSTIWMVVAVKTTSDLRIERAFTTTHIIGHYLKHPLDFLKVLITTARDVNLIEFYKQSFVGILGWLDTRFENWFYKISLVGLVLIAILSTSFKGIKNDYWSRITLISISVTSTILIFFALLVTWTPHPASVVSGVQGRYFIVPVIFLGYALSGNNNLLTYKRSSVSFLLLVPYVFLVSFLLPQVLINRYYSLPNPNSAIAHSMKPSTQLQAGAPIPLYLKSDYIEESVGLKAIQLMFGTYSRQNPGEAELRLYTKNGDSVTQRFALLSLDDNRYYNFKMDSKQYVSGEIISVSGTGISTWEVHDDQGNIKTCAIYQYSNGTKQRTPGCPKN